MRYLVALLLALVGFKAQAAFTVPEMTAPVNDYAQMLPPELRERLNGALRELLRQDGSQIAVLTVPTLDGETIEQASIKVVDKWKLGKAKADNGVLLFVAKDDRKIRIEVGQGLEGVLPDAYARRIVSDTMVPLFRDNRAADGIVAGVVGIASYTDPKANLNLGARPRRVHHEEREGGSIPLSLIIVLVIVVIILSRFGGGPWFWGGGGGGGFGSGGGGSFGGGGGGSSGGGGGFSGGGASDSW